MIKDYAELTVKNPNHYSGGESVMLRILALLVVMGGILLMPSYGLADGMQMITVVEKEVVKVDEDGKKIITYIAADESSIVPGDTVRYTISYLNNGEAAVDAGMAITNPVPAEMVYVGDSARGEGAVISFSINEGKTYDAAANLFVFDKNGKKRLAKPDEYTNIRWRFLEPLPPGKGGAVVYRAIVK